MSRRYAFLLTPTWLGWLGLCALFMVACVFLGQWQMDRRDQARLEIDRVVSNYDEDPVPYAEARDLFAGPDDQDEWTVVQVQGEYLGEDMRLARNRPHSGNVGYEQVMPFREAETGEVVVISRGWLATDSTDSSLPAANPEPPQGQVGITVRLKPGEPNIDRDAPDGQLASIDLAEYEDQVGYELMTGGYGLMVTEEPEPAESPRPLPRPELDEGPHLSYSMQWIAFGLLGFVGWGYSARVQARNNDLDLIAGTDDAGTRHAASGAAKQERLREAKRLQRLRSGRLSDEDVEDHWVEEHFTRR